MCLPQAIVIRIVRLLQASAGSDVHHHHDHIAAMTRTIRLRILTTKILHTGNCLAKGAEIGAGDMNGFLVSIADDRPIPRK